ncbi:MAG: Diguanylate cyclase (GGDEF) domain-containing protein [uncultured Thiotrichaceae bacterium]|uniref:diguanylate cyclase n=1 Tax=uncultured Thiotrichaceae bacterium TaxID=298394 RepID=A0A6S6T4Z3_9GAMM|nr:MAG: Diguanylate cyclase (GGDEF) domain-containing protein [uncultured Thiotrichaceae bacterium]
MKNHTKNFVDSVASVLSDQHEQLFFLNQYGSFYFWLHVLAAMLLGLLLWTTNAVAGVGILVWLMAISLLAVGSWLMKSKLNKYQRIKKDRLRQEQLVRYRLTTILLCAVWGMSGMFLFSEDPLIQVIHLCLLMVITLSVWPVSIVFPLEFYLQLTLLLLPVTLMFALQDNLTTNLLCFIVLAFAATAALMTQFFTQILKHLFTKEKSLIEQLPVDPVTKLMSSKYFEQAFKREWRRSARDQQPLSLILVEINGFREIQCLLDTAESRQYLSAVAGCLKSVAKRSADTLGHHDRAHFVALLPGTEEENARKVAKRLQLKVEEAKLSNPLDESRMITVAVGVSSCVPVMRNADSKHHATMSSPASLLEYAEQALERAKFQEQQSYTPIDLRRDRCGHETNPNQHKPSQHWHASQSENPLIPVFSDPHSLLRATNSTS